MKSFIKILSTFKRKRKHKPLELLYPPLDSHKWESKMEIRRFISGKPDMKPVAE